MIPTELQDKCRGALVGGAVGDALGYEVEFISWQTIRKRFGPAGISDYVLDSNGVAEFSDDTQMSLFTGQGILTAMRRGMKEYREMIPFITKAYLHWYATQTLPPVGLKESWLSGHIELWNRRAPGNTCMEALGNLAEGRKVCNFSKGCGGVMRVAPIGIFSATHPEILDLENAGYLAGYAAEITHLHPLSTYSSMVLAMIVAECINERSIDRDKFKSIVSECVAERLPAWFSEDSNIKQLQFLINKALGLAISETPDTEAIMELGEGWVAEETLAIAIFSVMRHLNDFGKCIRCAVNHDGDSDSTGAVAGNIIGAILGYSSIPEKYLEALELHDTLVSIADDLGGFSPQQQMKERY